MLKENCRIRSNIQTISQYKMVKYNIVCAIQSIICNKQKQLSKKQVAISVKFLAQICWIYSFQITLSWMLYNFVMSCNYLKQVL